MRPTFVIVGAGLAGASAAATLRQEGFDGQVVLVGAEPHLPYERPPLSKQYLRGEFPFEKAHVRPPGFYDENRIELRLGERVTQIEPHARLVRLNSGGELQYDRLLIATGVRNRRPAIPGLDLQGVFSLRSVEDADALRAQIAPGRRAVVVGMGFIGCEVAASLRQAGVEVVAIAPSPTPLFRVLGPQVGEVLAAIHADRGVKTVFGNTVTALAGNDRVECVITGHGRRIDCDFVVVGLGAEPSVEFLSGSAITLDDGVVVDEYCQSTVEHIYAAGDVANHFHPLARRRMRVEHWQNAMRQGAAAARSMLGKGQPYDDVPWFWSDQYDVNLQYAGFSGGFDQTVVRGALDARNFMVFYLNASRIQAVVALNRGKDLRRAMPLIKARTAVDPRDLADESTDLRKLAQGQLA
jgi:3-phenylpropionate/trans-cinnamate dioxygenase ferredoxin reductase subunit